MENYLLLARSVTHAQRMAQALENCGLRAGIFRAPTGLSSRGCSYAVRIPHSQWTAAYTCLQRAGLLPMGVFQKVGDHYREVMV